MPYIAIKSYPRNEEKRVALVEKINEAVMEIYEVSQGAVSISVEEIPKEEWDEKVRTPEMDPKEDKMYISHGVKKYGK